MFEFLLIFVLFFQLWFDLFRLDGHSPDVAHSFQAFFVVKQSLNVVVCDDN